MHVESSPPSAIAVESPAPEEHEKHDDDQNGCHKFLQQVSANRRGTGTRLVRQTQLLPPPLSFVGIVVPLVLGRIVGAIAVRGAIGARMTGIVAAGGIVVAIAVGWIFCVPGAPA
jgi:hypothetical protein